MSSHDHLCCCHIMTAAALVGMLQLLVVVLSMSSAGVILSRWENWEEWYDEAGERLVDKMEKWKNEIMDIIPKSGTTTTTITTTMDNETKPTPEPEPEGERDEWRGAFMEIQLANQLAVCSIWLLALLVYGLAFKFYRAVFVLPNFILQIITLIFTFSAIVGLSIRIGGRDDEEEEDERKQEYRMAILITVLVSAVVFWVLEIFFLVVLHRFYRFLKGATGGAIFPQIPSISVPMKPMGNTEDF